MESIAALGLACNIFQVISFSHETINLVRDVYGKGSIERPLAEYAVTLRDVAAHINAFELPEKPRKHEVQLRDNATKCHAVARDLGEEINFLLAEKAKGDLLRTLKTVAKITWRKRRLDRFEKQLRDLEKQMQSGLLARLYDKMGVMQVAQETLSQDVRHLLQQLRSGKTQASDLVLRDGLETRQHISLENSKLRHEILEHTDRSHKILSSRVDRAGQASAVQVTSHLDSQQSLRETSERRDRFIESLSFQGMNERRNQACDSYSGTSEWIFSEIESEQEKQSWDKFADWLRSNGSTYWISGKPGSGKTTLTKFILNNPKTKSLLQIWGPDAIVVSHFFWRPGSPMQQNIKGMLCSILQQLLRKILSSLEAVMSTIDDSSSKRHDDVCGDWSSTELHKSLMQALSHSHWPVLIVLDGLDEVHPDDGVLALLTILDIICSQHNVKMLLSSRPEALLWRRLSVLPHLRLQDLTWDDLRRYTECRLAPYFDTAWPGFITGDSQPFVDQLVSNAEGVFLWLALSITSVTRGIEGGDSLSQITARIDSLPTGIYSLYKDMWHRTTQDTTIYQATAALYYKLILASSTTNLRLPTETVVVIMLATTEWGERILDEGPEIIELQTVLAACKETERCLLLGCAGLLEVFSADHIQDANKAGSCWSQLQEYFYWNRKVQFVHRSARDFLLDTVEGRYILAYETSLDVQPSDRLISASLAAARIANRFHFIAGRYADPSPQFTRYQFILWNGVRGFLGAISDTCHDGAALSAYLNAILRKCGILLASGELKSESSTRVSGACNRREFLEDCGRRMSFEATHELHRTDAQAEELSTILFSRCLTYYVSSRPLSPDTDADFAAWWDRQTHLLQEIRTALGIHHSIDVNLRGLCWSEHAFESQSFTTTSFGILLHSLSLPELPRRWAGARIEKQAPAHTDHEHYKHILETICVFVTRGANLSQKIYFALGKTPGPEHRYAVSLTGHSSIWVHTESAVQGDGILLFYLRADAIIQRLVEFVKRHIPTLACSATVETLQSSMGVMAVKSAASFGQVLGIYAPFRPGAVAVSHEQSARLMGIINDAFWFVHSSDGARCKCNDIEPIIQEICKDQELDYGENFGGDCRCSTDCLLCKAASVKDLPKNPTKEDIREHCFSVLLAVGAMKEIVFTDDDGQTYNSDTLPPIWPNKGCDESTHIEDQTLHPSL